MILLICPGSISILRITSYLIVNMKYHDTILTTPGFTGYCNAIDKSRSMQSTQSISTTNNNTTSIQNIYNTRSMWSTGSISILLSSGVVVVLVSVVPFDPPLEN